MTKKAGKKRKAYAWGLWAETAAALLLRLKGYRVLGRRVRTPLGEIDLVARRGDIVAFVEVKARARIEDAAWSLTPRQQERIARAGAAWMGRHPELADMSIRFDIVLIAPWTLPRHVPGAFTA